MSSSDQKPPLDPADKQSFPPPPPPPSHPPSLNTHTQAPKHSNETPLPDYEIPGYNPRNPQFATPPTGADDDIYNATPTSEHPPQFPPSGDGHHDAAEGKKTKFSFKEYYHKATDSLSAHVGPAVNAMARKTGAEGFIAESLDKECEKAARILRAFCKDGIYADAPQPPSSTPAPVSAPANAESPATEANPSGSTKAKKPKVLLTIPSKVIAKAQGLAIFTAFRAGFQGTVSGGSGILIARKPDGGWSPPSGIKVGGVGGGFVIGAEIYDCVVVINTKEALNLFTKTRMSLGSDLAVTAGPFGAGGSLDWGVPANMQGKDKEKASPEQQPASPLSADNTHFQTAPISPSELTDPLEDPTKGRKPSVLREAIGKPVYSYIKSHGVYAGVQISGTVILSRDTANAKLYGRPVTVQEILEGKVESPAAAKPLLSVLHGATAGRPGQGVDTSPVTDSFSFGTAIPPTTPASPPAHDVAGVTAGVRSLDVGRPPSSTVPRPTTPVVDTKAAEAAVEARLTSPASPPPPSYSEFAPGSSGTHNPQEDLPPAYVEGEGSKPPVVDSKTGLQ